MPEKHPSKGVRSSIVVIAMTDTEHSDHNALPVKSALKFAGIDVELFENNLAMFEEIERGLPMSKLNKLSDFVAPHNPNWKFNIISVSANRLRRKEPDPRLSSAQSDKLVRVAKVARLALEIFGDSEKARGFLNRRHPLLTGNVPLDLAVANEAGAGAVRNILMAGAYSGGA